MAKATSFLKYLDIEDPKVARLCNQQAKMIRQYVPASHRCPVHMMKGTGPPPHNYDHVQPCIPNRKRRTSIVCTLMVIWSIYQNTTSSDIRKVVETQQLVTEIFSECGRIKSRILLNFNSARNIHLLHYDFGNIYIF